MLQSGFAAKREIRSLSFTETYQLLLTNWLLRACQVAKKAMVTTAQEQGVCAIVGARPDRIESRVQTNADRKVLKLMTVPPRVFAATIATLRNVA